MSRVTSAAGDYTIHEPDAEAIWALSPTSFRNFESLVIHYQKLSLFKNLLIMLIINGTIFGNKRKFTFNRKHIIMKKRRMIGKRYNYLPSEIQN